MASSPRLNPTLSLDQYAKAEAAAKANGMTLNEWIADLINKAILLAIVSGILYILT